MPIAWEGLNTKHQVEALSPSVLAQVQLDLLNAQTLEELRLEDGSPRRATVNDDEPRLPR